MLRRILLLLVLSCLLAGTAQARRLTIGMPHLDNDRRFPEVEAFFREAYRRAGVEVDFISLPALLDIDFADLGRTDGSLLRTGEAASCRKNLVRVPYPILLVDFVACTLREEIRIRRPADLAGYRVGVSRANLSTRGLCRKEGVKPVLLNSLISGIRMMEAGRIDVVLEERNTLGMVMPYLDKPLHCSPPLQQGQLYHWLNKRNADLAEPLAEAFKAMGEEGEILRVFGRYTAPSSGKTP
jgi:ABC-type amino acid transport substrate-binding protein